ncbi:putative extracellular lipase [Aspergillus novofumigatus IBT 16806]|uniref:Carboxylic ester hydrolase n=1 Tax=Aspergillus novofumigatus (strain IBT 16806) TaxID=1392255 RepID=A0A2I1BYG0_ASPN1|nr:carboxylesterase family protein [Aspergillus novofumigatus IBT 16806]PKX90410.1 carboxylesterase family protein [Aspergillus novofumigatus IBT 16806]
MFPSHRLIFLAAFPIILLFILQQGYVPFSIQGQVLSWLPDDVLDKLITRPTVHLRQGIVVGTRLSDSLPRPVDAFRGIPYALPPTGDRRFRRAVAVGSSNDTIDASRFGPRCPGKQLLNVSGDVTSSEDCLTVNVFRPHGVKCKLPVAVYVHGGAYNRGTASMHNTASMVGWSKKPFVAVSFNYRIGALGFLPSTVSAQDGILNLGLHDQILAFKWVQENIEAFGGDPSQVTLIGLSAGAHSIAHHIMNDDLGTSLFHRAVLESGAATSRAVHPYNAQLHETQFQGFITEAGCTDRPQSEIMNCLRSQPSSTVINASFTIFDRYNPSVRWAFQPVIDGDLIKRRPIDAWRSGKWNKMPILTGFNTNEGTYYVPSAMSQSSEFTNFFHTLLPAYSDNDIKTIDELYPDPAVDPSSPYLETRNIPVGPQYKRVEAAYGHYAYACPVRQTATLASAGQEEPMAYETFNPEVREISRSQEEIAGMFHAYITSFIVTGNPNAVGGRYENRTVWAPYDASLASGRKIMVFGEGSDERAGGSATGVAAQLVEDEWSRRECEFWWTKAGISDLK